MVCAGGEGEGEEGAEDTYTGNRWSAISRSERYKKRYGDSGTGEVYRQYMNVWGDIGST